MTLIATSPNIVIVKDAQNKVRHVDNLREVTQEVGGLDAIVRANSYVTENKSLFDLQDANLDLGTPVTFGPAVQEDTRLRFLERKTTMGKEGTSLVTYAQTINAVPIWQAGLAVAVIRHDAGNLRAVSSQSTIRYNISLDTHPIPQPPYCTTGITVPDLLTLLNISLPPGSPAPEIDPGKRLFYYQFVHDPKGGSFDPLQEGELRLPLKQVDDSITAGTYYLAAELLFSLKSPINPEYGVVNWRAFVELRTCSVMSLSSAVTSCLITVEPGTVVPAPAGGVGGAVAAPPTTGSPLVGATGLILPMDPLTVGHADPLLGSAGAADRDAALTALSQHQSLGDLVSDPSGHQQLVGERVQIFPALGLPNTPPPVKDPPYDFTYAPFSDGDNFTAVSAYYHVVTLFNLMQDLGFDINEYFLGETPFPMPVDPEGLLESVEARVIGNIHWDGTQGVSFGHLNTAATLGNGADVRVARHEFCHTLLWPHMRSPNFPFAHSAGDSLAAILTDPITVARTDPDRFRTFPWIMSQLPKWKRPRFHGGKDRICDNAGWCWGGEHDVNDVPAVQTAPGYLREQILSSTLFRLYQATGGDATAADFPGGDIASGNAAAQTAREIAARYVVYLIIRAIAGSSPSDTVPVNADDFSTALQTADRCPVTDRISGNVLIYHDPVTGTRIPAGTLHKVVRWSFEKQGLYQHPAPAAGVLVTAPGQPPNVDVYIDDGRGGEYNYTSKVWTVDTSEVWNRRNNDGVHQHQAPVAGVPNFLNIRIKNRGFADADNVFVNAYHMPAPPANWDPTAWSAFLPLAVRLPGIITPGGETTIALQWTPFVGAGEAVLATVSAVADLSNIDLDSHLQCATEVTPLERLVPFDNNLIARIM